MAAQTHARPRGRAGRRRSPDQIIASIAERQDGFAACWQLMEAGVSRHQIAFRLADGRLVERHRGVYQVGPVLTDRGRLRAAVLAGGSAAAVSHAGSLFIWEFRGQLDPRLPWVTVPPTHSARRPELTVVRSVLPARDIRLRVGFRVTSPPRTILDCARYLDLEDLEQLVAEAHYRGLAREQELRDQLARNPGKPGNRKLRTILELPGGARRLRSPGERGMLRLLRAHDIVGFECNALIHGFEVDLLWRELGVVVEVDGYDAHSGRRVFERDRVKIAALQARGLAVMPATGRRIREDPDGVLADLRAMLRAAAARLSR